MSAPSPKPPPPPHALGASGWSSEDRALAVAYHGLYAKSRVRFVRECCKIEIQSEGDEGEGGSGGKWVPFGLWPEQARAFKRLWASPRCLALKARQNGYSWGALAGILHELVFNPGSTALLLSLRETEAKELLRRLVGMHQRLPEFLRARKVLRGEEGGTLFELSTGSRAIALPANRGDSYTARIALVDEAALVPDLDAVLAKVEPTVGDGGKLWLVSRANKSDPEGTFARLARRALVEGGGQWEGVFSPWHDRPERDAAWYERVRARVLEKDGVEDALHEQYPSTPEEALAPRSGDKRLPPAWVLGAYERSTPLPLSALPRLAPTAEGLRYYALPVPGRRYRIGADPAEGLAQGDDSAVVVVDLETGEECAAGAGKWEPKEDLPELVAGLHRLYNGAEALHERNNHGHALEAGLTRRGVPLLDGPDGRSGYAKSPASKTALWDDVVAEVKVRAEARAEGRGPAPLIRDARVWAQVASLERGTCKAPSGQLDDLADAWGLAQWSRTRPTRPSAQQVAHALKGLRR